MFFILAQIQFLWKNQTYWDWLLFYLRKNCIGRYQYLQGPRIDYICNNLGTYDLYTPTWGRELDIIIYYPILLYFYLCNGLGPYFLYVFSLYKHNPMCSIYRKEFILFFLFLYFNMNNDLKTERLHILKIINLDLQLHCDPTSFVVQWIPFHCQSCVNIKFNILKVPEIVHM